MERAAPVVETPAAEPAPAPVTVPAQPAPAAAEPAAAAPPAPREMAPAAASKPALDYEASRSRRGGDAHLYKDSGLTGERTAAKAAKKGDASARRFAEAPPAAAPKAPADAKPAAAAKPADKMRLDHASDPFEGGFAPPPPPREEAAAGKRKSPVAAMPMKEDGRAASTTSRQAAPATGNKTLDDQLKSEAESRAPAASQTGYVGGGAAPRGPAAGFGSGAAQAAPAPAAAPRPAPARDEPAKRAVSAPAPAPVAASAPPPPPAPPQASLAKPRAKKSSSFEEADEGYAADSDAKQEKKQSSAKNVTNDSLLQRAERLFAEGRWTEAAAIYRELLRRDPHNDEADHWRRRLVAAEANDRNANLAEKRNAEAQDRARKAAPAAKAQKQQNKAAASDAAQ